MLRASVEPFDARIDRIAKQPPDIDSMAPHGSHEESKNAAKSQGQRVQFVLNDEPSFAVTALRIARR